MIKADLAVFIGRFQPFHRGHLMAVKTALSVSEHVLLLIGSANVARRLKNPFTAAEREAMIRASLSSAENQRLLCAAIDDDPYNDERWIEHVKNVVNQKVESIKWSVKKIILLGYKKDGSSYYLDLFPDWNLFEIENFEQISATTIRTAFLRVRSSQFYDARLPEAVNSWLNDFRKTPAFDWLQAEHESIDQEKAAWAAAPYPVIGVTVDALVVHRQQVLLVKRGRHPGKGLWALPGGFLQLEETLFAGCIRELQEETQIANMPWQQYLRAKAVYDLPDRSERGRVITHTFYFLLPDDLPQPCVCGHDDAAAAVWLPRDSLQAQDFFDDHFHLIRDLFDIAQK